MGNIVRWLIGIPVAALVTFMLFVLMKVLISGDFKPEEKVEAANFEINPTVEDIQVVKRTTKIDKVKKVITPPPPPQIERQQAAKPTEAIASLEGSIPDFEPPKIDRTNFKIQVSDRDAQPLVRIPPVIPPRFGQGNNSGYCNVRFDVSPDGAPFNITTTVCTTSSLERASVKSVQKWKYNPKIVDGRSVSRSGVETKISFNLLDERGRQLPLPSGY